MVDFLPIRVHMKMLSTLYLMGYVVTPKRLLSEVIGFSLGSAQHLLQSAKP